MLSFKEGHIEELFDKNQKLERIRNDVLASVKNSESREGERPSHLSVKKYSVSKKPTEIMDKVKTIKQTKRYHPSPL